MCETAKNASLKYVHCTYLHCLFTSLEATVLHLIASVSSLKHYLFASRTVSSLHVSEADVTHEHLVEVMSGCAPLAKQRCFQSRKSHITANRAS